MNTMRFNEQMSFQVFFASSAEKAAGQKAQTTLREEDLHLVSGPV